MKKLIIKRFLYILILFSIATACTTKKPPITEGIIRYELDFPEISKEEHPLISMLLPKEQYLFFKDNTVVTRIKKATFEINVRASSQDSTFYSDLKFNEKTHVQLEGSSLNTLLASLPKYTVVFIDETDTLAGFNIKKAEITKENGEIFDVWYTEDIELTQPNWYNPYREIPGVLVKYRITQNGVVMDFKAVHFTPETPSEEDFNFEPKGKQVSFSEFEANIATLFENLID